MFTRWLHLISPLLVHPQLSFHPHCYPRRFNLIFLESCTETDEACGAAECYIINGNRECLCFHGYSYDFTTKTCVDNNECASQGLFQFFKTYFPPFLTPNNLKWIKSCDFSQTEAC